MLLLTLYGWTNLRILCPLSNFGLNLLKFGTLTTSWFRNPDLSKLDICHVTLVSFTADNLRISWSIWWYVQPQRGTNKSGSFSWACFLGQESGEQLWCEAFPNIYCTALLFLLTHFWGLELVYWFAFVFFASASFPMYLPAVLFYCLAHSDVTLACTVKGMWHRG